MTGIYDDTQSGAGSRDAASGERLLAKFQQLESLAVAIRSPRPLETVIELVMGQISDVVWADAAAVWLHDTDNDTWYIGGSRGLTRRASQVSFKGDQTVHNKIGDQGEIVTNLQSAGFRRLYPEHDLIECALYAPMKIAGRRVGLIALYRNESVSFTDDDLRFVRAVGSHVGMAVSFAALEARAERLAVLEERARLGANLHDGILQIFSSIRVYASELRGLLEEVSGATSDDHATAMKLTLSQLEDCVESGSTDIAAQIEHLRTPDACRDVRRHLEVARDRLEQAGIPTRLDCEIRDIAPEVADALGWIAREAASNIIQHSRAQTAAVLAETVDGDIRMSIINDGRGVEMHDGATSDPDDLHLGLRIMRERAEQLGGALEVVTEVWGTVVKATVPAVPLVSGER